MKFDGDYSDPARHRAPSSVGTCLTFFWQTALRCDISTRYHTRIARSSRSDSQETAQRKVSGRKKENKIKQREACGLNIWNSLSEEL